MIINKPGVYDIPPAVYHADPVPGGSLSSTGARLLLTDSPAMYRFRVDHPKESKALDFGSVAHRLVLGKGDDYEVLDFPNRTTNAYKAAAKEARDAGKIPVLVADFQRAQTMAAVVRRNKVVADLFAEGTAEQSLFWKEAGIWRRAMIDWHNAEGPVDYKTTRSVDLGAISRAVWNYGYHRQDAWYRSGARALGLPADKFRFVFQLHEAPYSVRVVELDADAVSQGAADNETAARIFRDCSALDEWPDYPAEIETVSLPRWSDRTDFEESE